MAGGTCFLFPGQGSQYVGMGWRAFREYPIVRETFQAADDVLGFELSKLCFSGPAEELTDTINAQPAIFVVSMAYLRLYQEVEDPAEPLFVAGHSMGEYTALAAAGVVSFADGLRLVRERGRLMKEAGERNPGRMAAIIRLDVEVVEEICRQASGVTAAESVQIANYNAPGQVVISGESRAVERAMALATERGARRVIPLAVSIASHSPLMQYAAELLPSALNMAKMMPARWPIIANTTARPMTTPEQVRAELLAQLTSSVRWSESVEYMVHQWATMFLEIGPKDVLTGLVQRIAPEVTAVSLESKLGLTS